MNSSEARFLIINADDFGISPGVNRGVIHGHRHGLITSASLMVKKRWAWQAASMAAKSPDLSLGLHFDLGEWRFRNGEWQACYLTADLSSSKSVEQELQRQLRLFQDMVGRNPTHLDSHQHAHMSPFLRPVATSFSERLGIPLRQCTPGLHYCGRFYGQTAEGRPLPELITPDALIALIRGLPAGCTELSCHPSQNVDVDAVYGQERVVELETLCHPAVRMALQQESVVLCSFRSSNWRRSLNVP